MGKKVNQTHNKITFMTKKYLLSLQLVKIELLIRLSSSDNGTALYLPARQTVWNIDDVIFMHATDWYWNQ